MRINLSCPAELFQTFLPTEETPACSLLLFNLCDRVIASVEVSLRLLNRRGDEEERLVYRARALNGRPHTTFQMTVPCTPSAAVKRAEITIEKVWFADNAVWRRKPEQEAEYISNVLPVSRSLSNLKYVAGENAVGYPSQQDGLWVCVCGRPNADREEICSRCLRSKEEVFTRFNREAVEKLLAQKERQLELKSRSAREDTARLQRIREENYQAGKRKNRRRRLLLLAIVAAAAVCGLAVFFVVPATRLYAAKTQMESGQLEEAEETFASLEGFPGADSLMTECRYLRAARDAAESEDPEILRKAAETLRSQPDREEAGSLADEADFRRAGALLRQGQFVEAREAIAGLTGDKVTELTDEIDYLEACDNMEQRYYVLARNVFLRLEDYRDSAERADACIYLPSLALMENGEYDAAVRQLERIPDYEDSRELILKCYYLKGLTLEQREELEAAAEAYRQAGDYEDASERFQALTLTLAEDAFEVASFEKAEMLYARIPGYADADDKRYACLYMMARQALSDLEYNRGLELLEQLPDGYEDREELIRKAAYQEGLLAEERGEWETAAALFAQAGDERDASRRLERILAAMDQAGQKPEDFPTAEETSTPTEEPTSTPTEEPTATQTEEPTATPTEEPTSTPTEEPTPTPTEEPTVPPTQEPTEKLTAEPTAVPTETPNAFGEGSASGPETEKVMDDQPEGTDSFLVRDEE